MYKSYVIPVVIVVVFVISAGTNTGRQQGQRSSLFQREVKELRVVALQLEACEKRLKRILSSVPGPNSPTGEVNSSVKRLEAILAKLQRLDGRAGLAMDSVVDAHLRDSSDSMTPVLQAAARVRSNALEIAEAIGDYLELVDRDLISPELLQIVLRIRDLIEKSMVSVPLEYYEYYIPIRFVQFVNDTSQILSEQRLQYNIDLTNQIFFPARMRFFLRANIPVLNSEFTYLYLRDPNGNLILDEQGRRQHGWYTWPDETWRSPLIWPLYWGGPIECEELVPPGPTDEYPEGGVETRYNAQMRAGTYCCPDGELLVYINQGRSNGGQYPWYSRIIGMTSGHMADPTSPSINFTFPHEVGHYFGLPHTFPDHNPYPIDYDLARMIDCPDEGDPCAWERRFYTTHDNLVNPETGDTAELSLFWDLVFKPIYSEVTPTQHMFFNSREDAAVWDGQLEPIEQWSNGWLCRQTDVCCNEFGSRVWLQLMVGAGCRGVERDFTDCLCPAEPFCTGHPAVSAFSRFAYDPNKIQLNVMSYGYPMPDGSDAPKDIVEMSFLCGSQIEQIHRVMTYDVLTFFYDQQHGKRPTMDNCALCHDW